MSPLLVIIFTFIGTFLAVVAANLLFLDIYTREKKRARRRQDEMLRKQQVERAKRQSMLDDFGGIAADAREESKVQKPRRRLERGKFFVEQSGLNVTLSQLALFSLGLAVLAGMGAWLQWQNATFVAVGGLIGGLIPAAYVAVVRRQRLARLRTQLPDAFDLMGRVMRSGQSVSQAMQAVGEEFSQPISLEFLYTAEQMNLGLSQESALNQLARRTGMLEVKIFVLAVLVHRQTGGNLAELLDNLAHVVRERFRIQGMISSLTAQGRMQAVILLSLPPAMFCVLMVISPTYEILLLDYPSIIMVALGMMAFGWLWIQRIINFDF